MDAFARGHEHHDEAHPAAGPDDPTAGFRLEPGAAATTPTSTDDTDHATPAATSPPAAEPVVTRRPRHDLGFAEYDTTSDVGIPQGMPIPLEMQSGLDDAIRSAVDPARVLHTPVQQPAPPAPEATDATLSGLGTQVVTCFSLKGGAGTTTVAVNIASHAATRLGRRTLLLDFDTVSGDVALACGIDPSLTLFDLVCDRGDLDPEKLASYVTVHPQTGMHVLPAPPRPEDAEMLRERSLHELIAVARHTYELIVIDTPASFDRTTLTALDRTDTLLVVTNPNVTALKATSLTLDILRRLRFASAKTHVVLNHPRPASRGESRLAGDAIGRVPSHAIPFDPAAPRAFDQGTPLTVLDPRAPSMRSIDDLCRAHLRSIAVTGSPPRRDRRSDRRRRAWILSRPAPAASPDTHGGASSTHLGTAVLAHTPHPDNPGPVHSTPLDRGAPASNL